MAICCYHKNPAVVKHKITSLQGHCGLVLRVLDGLLKSGSRHVPEIIQRLCCCSRELRQHLARCRPGRDEPTGGECSLMEVFSSWALPAADSEGEEGGGGERERVSPLFIHQTLWQRREEEEGGVTEVYGAVWMDLSLGYSGGGGGQCLEPAAE